MKKGLFITLEGTEGAGKSSLLKKLHTELKKHHLPVTLTREPGGTPFSEKVRNLLLQENMDPWTECFLLQAARREHMVKKILPDLEQKKIVICDRFTDSTLAYQGFARGLDLQKLENLNRLATGSRKPDLTIWLDLDPEIGLKRAKNPNRFEEEGVKFQKKVRQGFLYSYKKNKARWLRIRTDQCSQEEVFLKVWKRLQKDFEL